jgi:hypothetical protein
MMIMVTSPGLETMRVPGVPHIQGWGMEYICREIHTGSNQSQNWDVWPRSLSVNHHVPLRGVGVFWFCNFCSEQYMFYSVWI